MIQFNKYTVVILVLFCSCSSDFLEIKPQKQQVIVETLDDVEALLNNASTVMNVTDYFRLISDGDLHFNEERILMLPEVQRNLYIWEINIDPAGYNTEVWDIPYRQIMYANIALETLDELSDNGDNEPLFNTLRGRALFFRAWAHYQLLQDFAEGYEPRRADQLGIPIITDSSFPKQVTRPTLTAVYDAIVTDLQDASVILPTTPQIKTHPSQQASFLLLSRVYQNIGDVEASLRYAEQVLQINDQLLDFNNVYAEHGLSYVGFNYNTHPEVIFFTNSNLSLLATEGIEVDQSLYDSYLETDLRKSQYFDTNRLLNPSHSGSPYNQFTGLAIDEAFLIKAECLARLGRLAEAASTLAILQTHRYRKEYLPAKGELTQESLLQVILGERRKELVGRGTRWTDLKRLNRDTGTQSILQRGYQQATFTLLPNDSRYVFEIPWSEIEMTQLEQNKR